MTMGRSCLVCNNTPGLMVPSFSRISEAVIEGSGLVIGKLPKGTWKARIEVVTGCPGIAVLATAKAVKHYSNRRLGEEDVVLGLRVPVLIVSAAVNQMLIEGLLEKECQVVCEWEW